VPDVDSADRDQRTVRLTDDAHAKLTQLKDSGIFGEMLDGYRMAIGIALAEGIIDSPENRRGRTYLNAGSLDPDGVIRDVIVEMFPASEGSPYEIAERLAEAGIQVLSARIESNPEVGVFFKEEQVEPATPDADANAKRSTFEQR
jgi:hypothetical protein